MSIEPAGRPVLPACSIMILRSFAIFAVLMCGIAEAAEPARGSSHFNLFLPDHSWSIELDLHQFSRPALEVSSDLLRIKLTATAPKANALVTVQIQPAEKANLRRDGAGCCSAEARERWRQTA